MHAINTHRRITGRLGITAGLGLAALIISACGSSTGPSTASSGSSGGQLTVVKFAGPSAPNGVVAQVAYGLKQGIFKKYHIDMEISYPSTGLGLMPTLLVKNTYTMTISDPQTIMSAYTDGEKLLAIFSEDEANANGITLLQKEHITTPQDLAGKTLGYPTGTTGNLVVDAYLKHYNVNPSSVKLIALSYAALESSLVSGAINGIVAFPYAYDPLMHEQGLATNDLLFKTVPSLGTISLVLAVSANWAAANPTAARNLVLALQESTTEALAHPEQAGKDLIATAPAAAPPLTATTQQWTADQPFMKSSATEDEPYGYMALSDWTASLRYGEQFLGVKPVNVSDLYTNKYLSPSI